MKIGNSVALVLVLFFATHSAHALDPRQPFSSYIQTHFTDADGLNSSIVNEIVQSPDGFLWITYGSGALDRFDGQHFSTRANDKIMTMALALNGDLWLATSQLFQLPAATLNQVSPLQTISHPDLGAAIISLHFSRSGILWVGTIRGLYRFEHGVLSCPIPNVEIYRIEESARGDLLLTSSQGLIVWDGSQAVLHPELATQLGINGNDIH